MICVMARSHYCFLGRVQKLTVIHRRLFPVSECALQTAAPQRAKFSSRHNSTLMRQSKTILRLMGKTRVGGTSADRSLSINAVHYDWLFWSIIRRMHAVHTLGMWIVDGLLWSDSRNLTAIKRTPIKAVHR